ncbi:putative la rna-binding domain protein [Balamuthia mandrillaris]
MADMVSQGAAVDKTKPQQDSPNLQTADAKEKTLEASPSTSPSLPSSAPTASTSSSPSGTQRNSQTPTTTAGGNVRKSGTAWNGKPAPKVATPAAGFVLEPQNWPSLGEAQQGPAKTPVAATTPSSNLEGSKKNDVRTNTSQSHSQQLPSPPKDASGLSSAPGSSNHNNNTHNNKYGGDRRNNKRPYNRQNNNGSNSNNRNNGNRNRDGNRGRRQNNHYQYPSQTSDSYLLPRYGAIPTMPVLEGEALTAALLYQVEYYFSIENLCKDIFLRTQMDDEGYVPIALIASFNKLKQILAYTPTQDLTILVDALANSSIVQLDDTRTKLRRKDDWLQWLYPTKEEREFIRKQMESSKVAAARPVTLSVKATPFVPSQKKYGSIVVPPASPISSTTSSPSASSTPSPSVSSTSQTAPTLSEPAASSLKPASDSSTNTTANTNPSRTATNTEPTAVPASRKAQEPLKETPKTTETSTSPKKDKGVWSNPPKLAPLPPKPAEEHERRADPKTAQHQPKQQQPSQSQQHQQPKKEERLLSHSISKETTSTPAQSETKMVSKEDAEYVGDWQTASSRKKQRHSTAPTSAKTAGKERKAGKGGEGGKDKSHKRKHKKGRKHEKRPREQEPEDEWSDYEEEDMSGLIIVMQQNPIVRTASAPEESSSSPQSRSAHEDNLAINDGIYSYEQVLTAKRGSPATTNGKSKEKEDPTTNKSSKHPRRFYPLKSHKRTRTRSLSRSHSRGGPTQAATNGLAGEHSDDRAYAVGWFLSGIPQPAASSAAVQPQKEKEPTTDVKNVASEPEVTALNLARVLPPPALLQEQGCLLSSYPKFRERCLEERTRLGPGKSKEMNTLYRFWSHFLRSHFSQQMYNDLKSFALADAEQSHRYGLHCLFRFYSYALERKMSAALFQDFQRLTLTDYNGGSLYGLEKFWAFMKFNKKQLPVTLDPLLEELLASRPSLNDFRPRHRTKEIKADLSSPTEFPPLSALAAQDASRVPAGANVWSKNPLKV